MTPFNVEFEVQKALVELFEVDVAKIKPDARLYEDLGLDSIDAVDLVVRLQELSGRKIQPDDFKSIRTIRDLIAATEKIIRQP